MRVSTVRFSEDHWKLLEGEAMREGVSAAQFIRDATMVRTAYAMGQRGDEGFEEALARVRPRPDADPPERRAQRRQALLDAAAAVKDSDRLDALHATGLFGPGGELLLVREDVGRHNAMDKVVGRLLLDGGLPLPDRVLCVSGRLSFELVQKAAVAGCPVLVGVGAPTSLAISLAADRGLTLAGFARRGRVNVYTHPERVVS